VKMVMCCSPPPFGARAIDGTGWRGNRLYFHRCGSAVDDVQFFRRPLRNVDLPTLGVGATIVNADANRTPILQVCDQST
jgi:hypothetical protein